MIKNRKKIKIISTLIFVFVASIYAKGSSEVDEEKPILEEKNKAESVSNTEDEEVIAVPSNYELTSGNLKLVVFKKTGNFCLYALKNKEKENYASLYDDRMNGSSNKFFVYYNGRSYELKKKLGRKVTIKEEDNAINIIFEFNKNFTVIQRLSFIQLGAGSKDLFLKIETSVKNMSTDLADISVKALIDTKLGEKNKIPFSTNLHQDIVRETVISPKHDNDNAIISGGLDFACMFLINYKQITPIDKVFIAGRDRLVSYEWLPKIVEGRSFSSKYSHNDSALLFTWPIERRERGQKFSVSMLVGHYDYLMEEDTEIEERKPRYLTVEEKEVVAVAKKPASSKFVKEEEQTEEIEVSTEEKKSKFMVADPAGKKEKAEAVPDTTNESKFTAVEPEVETEAEIVSATSKESKAKKKKPKKEKKAISKLNENPEPHEPEIVEEKVEVKVKKHTVTAEEIKMYIYIQSLIDKINEMEENLETTSITELEDLSKEVDWAIKVIKDKNN